MSREHRRALARRFVAVAGLLRADRIGEAQATAMDAQVELDWLAGGDQLVRGAQPRWQWEWTVWLAAAVGAAGFQRWMLPEYAQLTVDQPGWNGRVWIEGHSCVECFMPADGGHLISCSRHHAQPDTPPE